MEAIIFDMDGTLLHSLPDLALATNQALERMGFPQRSYDEILTFMGNGAERLIERATPPGTSTGARARTFELWRSIYLQSDYAHTAPFPGMVDALELLRNREVKTAILSNKFDAGVHALADRFFPNLFDAVRGEIPPTPRKPDPASLLAMLSQMGVSPCNVAYVGDTRVDLKTARNAGVMAVGVAWGYDSAAPLPVDQLDAYLRSPAELASLLDA